MFRLEERIFLLFSFSFLLLFFKWLENDDALKTNVNNNVYAKVTKILIFIII